MVGFTIKKKKDKKDDDLSGSVEKPNKKKDKKRTKKEKKDKKSQEGKDVEASDTEEENKPKSSWKETCKRIKKGKRGKKDNIEQHREDYEDSIEKHREEFENAQFSHLQDWYEEESLAMDLESLKRKPWYNKQPAASREDTRFAKTKPKAKSKERGNKKEESSKEKEGKDSEEDKNSDDDSDKQSSCEEETVEDPRGVKEAQCNNHQKSPPEGGVGYKAQEDSVDIGHYRNHAANGGIPIASAYHTQPESNGGILDIVHTIANGYLTQPEKSHEHKFMPIGGVPAGNQSQEEIGQEYKLDTFLGVAKKDVQAKDELKMSSLYKANIPSIGTHTKKVMGQEYKSNSLGVATNNYIEAKERFQTSQVHESAQNGFQTKERFKEEKVHGPTRVYHHGGATRGGFEELEDEIEFIQHNGVPVGIRTRQVIEDEVERLDYARQSLARLQRIEEIRKNREQLKVQLEEKRRRRKERSERARRNKRLQRETRRAISGGEHRADSRRNQYSSHRQQSYSYPESGCHADPEDPLLVDLTDVCDRKGSYILDPPSDRWKPGFKEEIPVIVDLTNSRKPQQILDLTKMDEPPRTDPPMKLPKPRGRSLHIPPPTHHNVSPHSPSRRLVDLRRDREAKLHKMTDRFYDHVTTKDRSPHTTVFDKPGVEASISPFKEMMERVTRNVKQPSY